MTEYEDYTLRLVSAINNINKLEELLKDENKPDLNINYGYRGDTVLIKAVQTGNIDVINLLLKYGADVNKSNKSGETPLIEATIEGYYDIAKLLFVQYW